MVRKLSGHSIHKSKGKVSLTFVPSLSSSQNGLQSVVILVDFCWWVGNGSWTPNRWRCEEGILGSSLERGGVGRELLGGTDPIGPDPRDSLGSYLVSGSTQKRSYLYRPLDTPHGTYLQPPSRTTRSRSKRIRVWRERTVLRSEEESRFPLFYKTGNKSA